MRTMSRTIRLRLLASEARSLAMPFRMHLQRENWDARGTAPTPPNCCGAGSEAHEGLVPGRQRPGVLLESEYACEQVKL